MTRYIVLRSAILAFVLLPGVAHADTLTLSAVSEFSGGQEPFSGTPPWIVVSFDDHGGTGSVDFTLTAPNLTSTENVEQLYINLDPALIGNLPLTFGGLVKGGSFDTPTISQGDNAFKADGDGEYDILLSFTPGGNTSKTFTIGDSLQYTITGAGLTANSFAFLSNPAGGHGPFYFAAHSQNTTGAGSGGSGWVTGPATTGGAIPEPAAATLALLGTACFAVFAKPHRTLRRRYVA